MGTSAVREMDESADVERARARLLTVLKGKKELGIFDVFLCHNSLDKPLVRKIHDILEELGIRAWLDEKQLRPGFSNLAEHSLRTD